MLLEDYFKRFSSKNCFYDDVKDYLGLLDQQQTQEVCLYIVGVVRVVMYVWLLIVIKETGGVGCWISSKL